MKTPLNIIAETGILPVICLPSAEDSEALACALRQGGLNSIEITLRAAWSLEAIRRIHGAFPDMLIGAGTVFNSGQVDLAMSAGATFIVTPGLDPAIVLYCQAHEIPVVPGCASPTDLTVALGLGLTAVKFFPAELSGGAAALKLFHGPFADMQFIPTGGLTVGNIGTYLDLPYVAACGGSYMAPSEDLRARNFGRIVELCKKSVEVSLGIEFSHLELPGKPTDATLQAFQELHARGCLPALESAPLAFGESGTAATMVYRTRSVQRALAWYRRQTDFLREDSIEMDDKGKPVAFRICPPLSSIDVKICG